MRSIYLKNQLLLHFHNTSKRAQTYYSTEVDQETLERLRVRCVNDVKRTNGQIRFKDILQFQKEP